MKSLKANKAYGPLLALLAFFMPISVFITDVLIFLISAVWLFEGRLLHKWNIIKSSNWMLSILILIILYVLALSWGRHHSDADWVLEKTALLLFLPILYSLNLNNKKLKIMSVAFLASMTFSSIIAILINVNVLPRLVNLSDVFSSANNISAFMSYNYHNLYLAFAILLTLVLLFQFARVRWHKFILFVSLILMIISLITEAGRAGHILSIVLPLFYFRKKIVFLAISFFTIAFIILLSFHYSNDFNRRFKETVTNTVNLNKDNFNSISVRYYMFKHSLDIIKKQPLLGSGTGSFVDEFTSLGPDTIKYLENQHKTPHNNFLYVLLELGVVGLIVFLAIFYYQIKEYLTKHHAWIRVFFVVLFLLTMFSDAFFQNHNSAILYVFMSIIYNNYSSK